MRKFRYFIAFVLTAVMTILSQAAAARTERIVDSGIQERLKEASERISSEVGETREPGRFAQWFNWSDWNNWNNWPNWANW